MALHFGKAVKRPVVGKLRRTQLVTTFGSGAIVDMPDYSVIIAATDYWNSKSPVLHEPNLEKMLKVSGFKEPYVTDNGSDKIQPDVPAFRFPLMHFCPNCGKLMPYWGFGDDAGHVCRACNKNIVPSRFVAACVNGHLEDFPYKWWVHYGNPSSCPAYEKDDRLKISFSDETGGLDSIIITCTACGKSRSMAGSLSRDALKGYHCRGKRPWIGLKKEHNDPKPCSAKLRGLQRGASNVYFSQTVSALTIPPWSNKINQKIDECWDSIREYLESDPDEKALKAAMKMNFSDFLNENPFYTVDDIVREISRRQQSDQSDSDYTQQKLYEDEYKVFGLRNYEQPDDVQFRIESTEVPEALSEYLEDVILVKRLREVLALKGFRRITPEKPETSDEIFQGYDLPDDCVPLSESPLNWYPGIEMLGEGIFIRLNEEKLSAWEQKNANHYSVMEERLQHSNVSCENFSARYVLLHTLSHLLIRQLSIECGYSGAAIKERIYSTYPDSTQQMAGILLYTSSSDADGSLGGLVRNGFPETFESVFQNMLEAASWCSSDPICIESTAQGYDSLNYAACHACTLLPETSCEKRNCLLDRGAVVGSIFDRSRGFFGELF